MTIDARALDVLENIYGLTVRFSDRRQVMICHHCKSQRSVHHDECPYRFLGEIIDDLQRQASQGRIDTGEHLAPNGKPIDGYPRQAE